MMISDILTDFINEIFAGLDITHEEKETMHQHHQNSPYSLIYITRAWRDRDGVICVEYDKDDTRTWFHYRAGEWW